MARALRDLKLNVAPALDSTESGECSVDDDSWRPIAVRTRTARLLLNADRALTRSVSTFMVPLRYT